MATRQSDQHYVRIPAGAASLEGDLSVPAGAAGVVLFAHGSGSSRHSRRNQYVARVIREVGLGTLLFDLLTLEEEAAEAITRHLRFDIALLAQRLLHATQWVIAQPETRRLRIGYFGASTGAAAALVAAARERSIGAEIGAVVSRGGRPDLAGTALAEVRAPTLLIVGGADTEVLALNRQAYAQLVCEKHLDIVPGASHLFEEAGALEQAAQLAARWFDRYLHSETIFDRSKRL